MSISNLPEPSEDDLAYVREILDSAPAPERPTLDYVIASLIAGEREMILDGFRQFAAQIDARAIVLRDRPLEQAQVMRNIPAAIRKLTDKQGAA